MTIYMLYVQYFEGENSLYAYSTREKAIEAFKDSIEKKGADDYGRTLEECIREKDFYHGDFFAKIEELVPDSELGISIY